jgi:hypothetical protein
MVLACFGSQFGPAQENPEAAMPLLTNASVNAKVMVRGAGWPVSSESILQAAQRLQPSIDWSQAQVAVSPQPRARSEKAGLRAIEVRTGRKPGALVVRLQCSNSHDCAPFWAKMDFPQGFQRSDELNLTAKLNVPPFLATRKVLPHPTLVHPGRIASLLFDQNGLRISMTVMPLKRAALGESVRVYDPVTRRVFLASVCGKDLLQSDLRETK